RHLLILIQIIKIQTILKIAILTTRNTNVEDINQLILQKIPDFKEFEYLSANFVENKDQEDQSLYPVEFLNTLTPSGILPYRLVLKKDVPVILLHNLDPTKGLYN
ncbi:26356_t:CDS:1, partial [Gigaspora margarita]